MAFLPATGIQRTVLTTGSGKPSLVFEDGTSPEAWADRPRRCTVKISPAAGQGFPIWGEVSWAAELALCILEDL